MSATNIQTRQDVRIVRCPECGESCGWCSWTRSLAREVGCGLRVPSGGGRPRRQRYCQWGEAAKGQPCQTCDGSGKVRATITYERQETMK